MTIHSKSLVKPVCRGICTAVALLLVCSTLAGKPGDAFLKTKVDPGRAGVFVDGKYMGPAANFKVGSGYWVRLPVFGWYTSKGNCLEGKGVLPDVVVEVDPPLLNAGVDQQMKKAVEILS